MPIIDGKRIKARYTSLWLDELSCVDHPAQEGAQAIIMKRAAAGESLERHGAMHSFETKVREIAKRDGITKAAAMQTVRRECPELFTAAYRGSASKAELSKVASASIAKARQEFVSLVREIAERDRVPEHVAMCRARIEAPAIFAAAFN